jgi:peptidoglycan-associated lipoprotein
MVAAVALLGACQSADETVVSGTSASDNIVTKAPAPTSAKSVSIVAGSQADFVSNVGDRVFFEYDVFGLTPEAKEQLIKWVAFMQKYPRNNLTIEGHADERGTREYNLALGERRANSIQNFLVSHGIASSRLRVISYGKERPDVIGSNESSWARNRRGVGVIQ